MKFYYFGADFSSIDKVYDAGFDGNLFLYDSSKFEHFTEIAYNASAIKKDFKYMVAIRPYVISPQYLYMICKNIYDHFGDILEINLVSGWPKREERFYNFFLGEVNDSSSTTEKSDYLIKYIEALNGLKGSAKSHLPDAYVSATNEFTLQASIRLNNKMILPYHIYQEHADKLDKGSIIVSMTPVVKNNKLFKGSKDIGNDHVYGTEEEVMGILKALEVSGVHGVLLTGFGSQQPSLFRLVARYKNQITL